MGHVFISHANARRDAAERIKEQLELGGLATWMAPGSIRDGERWPTAISEGVHGSDAMVVVVSEEAVTSPHVGNEVGIAVAARVPILPVFLGDVHLRGDLLYFLQPLHRVVHRVPLDDDAARSVAGSVRRLLELDRADDAAMSPHVPAPDARPPGGTGPTAFRVTRQQPAYFAFLIDCSHSMNRRVDDTTHRRDVVARTVNDVIDDLVFAATKEDETFHYFDVSVVGYGLGDGREAASLLDADVMAIQDVKDHCRWETTTRLVETPDGERREVVEERPVWVEPTANTSGHTVTRTAFETIHPLLDAWVRRHPDSIPPIVLHITDGGWPDDQAPHAAVRALGELATEHGSTLVFNAHLSFGGGRVLAFPSAEAGADLEPRMRDLLDLSSVLPERMVALARESGYDVGAEARGYILNGDATALSDFIDIGTLGQERGL